MNTTQKQAQITGTGHSESDIGSSKQKIVGYSARQYAFPLLAGSLRRRHSIHGSGATYMQLQRWLYRVSSHSTPPHTAESGTEGPETESCFKIITKSHLAPVAPQPGPQLPISGNQQPGDTQVTVEDTQTGDVVSSQSTTATMRTPASLTAPTYPTTGPATAPTWPTGAAGTATAASSSPTSDCAEDYKSPPHHPMTHH